MYLKRIVSGTIAIGLVSSLYAYEMKPVGFKAVGMGGTGVANTRGSLAGYYNPALLRLSDYTSEISLNLSGRLRESNIADNMDTLSNIDFQTTLDNIARSGTSTSAQANSDDQQNMKKAIDTLKAIGTNNALQLSVQGSLTGQFGDAFAIGLYTEYDAGLQLNIDTNRLELIFKNGSNYYKYDPVANSYSISNKANYQSSSLEYAVDNGLSYINFNVLNLTEIPLSYAKAYDWNSGFWSFGLNVKPMFLKGHIQKLNLGEDTDTATDEDDSAYEVTYKSTLGIDLGLAYQPSNSDLTIGLVGKNINSPKFKVDTLGSQVTKADDVKLDPYFRAGISYPVLNNSIEFALDIDLQKSETIISGEETQMVGAGIEIHPSSWFALRLGAMQDIASETYDDGTILTAGLGFGLKWVQVDLSIMASTETGEFDGTEIPRYFTGNLSLVSRWGDGYNQKKPNNYSQEDYTEKVTPISKKTEEVAPIPEKTKKVAPASVLTEEKMKSMEKQLDEETK